MKPGHRISTSPRALTAPFGSKVQSLPPPCACDKDDCCAAGVFKVAHSKKPGARTRASAACAPTAPPSSPVAELPTTNYEELMEDVYTALREQYGSHLPGTREFQRFFSPASFTALRKAVFLQSGGFFPADEDLVQKMLVVYTDNPAVACDPTEPCRENVPPAMADKHVRKLMQRVVEELGYEVAQANAMWDFYAQNLNRPSDVPNTPIDCRCKTGADAATHGDWFMDSKY
jgi:hypothetical protein